jgi:hypothetical protein
MLQQTRVAQGTLFLAFQLHSYFFDLAEANEEEVLKWQDFIITLGIFTKQLNT